MKMVLSIVLLAGLATGLATAGTAAANDQATTVAPAFVDTAFGLARSNGDDHPRSIGWVRTTLAGAEQIAGNRLSAEASDIIVVSHVTGSFTLYAAHTPPRRQPMHSRSIFADTDLRTDQTPAWGTVDESSKAPSRHTWGPQCRMNYYQRTAPTLACSKARYSLHIAAPTGSNAVTPFTACANPHCYNYVGDNLTNSGFQANVFVRCQTVPSPTTMFLTEEVWVYQGSGETGNWIEAGSTVGINNDPGGRAHAVPTLYWARRKSPHDYYEIYRGNAPLNTNLSISVSAVSTHNWEVLIGSQVDYSSALTAPAQGLDVGDEELLTGGLESGAISGFNYYDRSGTIHAGLPGSKHYNSAPSAYYSNEGVGYWRFTMGSTNFNACDQ